MLNFENLNNYQKISFTFIQIQAVIGIIGIIANLLTILVFAHKRLKHTSYSVYYRAMAAFDTFLLLHTFRHWLRFNLGFDLDILSPILYKFGEYQPHVAGHTSLWLLTVILVDRLIIIVYRNRIRLIKQRFFQIILIFIIFFYSSLLHLILPFNYELTHEKVQFNSTTLKWIKVCRAPVAVLQLNSWLVFVNTFIIMITNVTLYAVLIAYIYKRKRKFTHRSRLVISRDLKFVICSLALTITNFVSKIPLGMGLFVAYWIKLSPDQLQAVFTVCVTIAIVSHGATLFVCSILNSTFYDELKFIICSKKQSQ